MTAFSELISTIANRNPMHGAFLRRSMVQLQDDERDQAIAYVEHCLHRHCTLVELADAYLQIVQDTFEEQMYFRRHGRYRCSTFAEVADHVYYCDSYMRVYMLGLALTGFLWPNHVAISRFFVRSQRSWRTASGGYLEVGPGHGLYFLESLRHGAHETYTAIDISPTSLELTRALVEDWRGTTRQNWTLLEADFLEADLPTDFQAIVMGEVLEHVEKPQAFLVRMRELAAPGAFLFVTTCINAPAVDHIYLYEDVAAVEAQVSGAGLRVQERLVLPYEGKTLSESMQERLPVNIAMVLTPNDEATETAE